MNLIFIGPQGSGKGTQAKMVAEKFGICHISVGDLLRNLEGRKKKKVEEIMSSGEMVPNEIVEDVLGEKLKSEECGNGFILDGYPRTFDQLEFFEGRVDIDKVIEISISDEEAVRRVGSRRNCAGCGAIYNLNSLKPKVEGVCDKCGGELVLREDDNEEAIQERLRIYHDETEKILERYTSIRVDGEQDVDKVFKDIVKELN